MTAGRPGIRRTRYGGTSGSTVADTGREAPRGDADKPSGGGKSAGGPGGAGAARRSGREGHARGALGRAGATLRLGSKYSQHLLYNIL